MIVIPAVDIKGGNCVRLLQGRAEDETIYSDDPVAMAKKWQSQGAERLHVVDLDGAFSGEMKNMPVILEIARKLDIPVEVGGGIRDFGAIQELIDGGIFRVILGTAAINDREFLHAVLERWFEHITVGIDSRDGLVAVKGWQEVTRSDACTLAVEMADMGVTEIIVTDIKTDGMLTGPNTGLMSDIAGRVDISVIASGGISCIEDVVKLKELNLDNLNGIIVGKALYSNSIDLGEAIKVAGG